MIIVPKSSSSSSHYYNDDKYNYYSNFGDDISSIYVESSNTARRILQDENNTKYVSYAALSADSIPCNIRGASYYNCNSDQKINPYRRGCTQITRCARTNS